MLAFDPKLSQRRGRHNSVKETYKYEFEIPAESGTVSFEYSSEMPLRHSPIKGYVPKDSRIYKNGPNELKYSPYDKKFWITVLVAALVVLCAGIAIGMFLPDMNKSEANGKDQLAYPAHIVQWSRFLALES